jgi:transketolase
MTNDYTVKTLEEKARKIRRHVINMIYNAGSGHPGGSLSCVDIMTILYFHIMEHNPLDPKWKDRDRFILSKGHAAPSLYATLAESGYFPIEELSSLRKIGSMLQGHSDSRIPGVEVSSGSLGQGLSVASGIAYAGKLDKKDFKVYALLGDGECDEGQIWEAAMFAHHYRLDNLVAIIDRNHFQIDGSTESIMSIEPFAKKWEAFGWYVIETNGNNIKKMTDALERIKNIKDKPVAIIAHTIKGKGISFMENNNAFHGKSPSKEEMEIALRELSGD